VQHQHSGQLYNNATSRTMERQLDIGKKTMCNTQKNVMFVSNITFIQ